jgi:hypothetical protein
MRRWTNLSWAAAVLILSVPALGRMPNNAPGAGGVVSLPYITGDGHGGNWMVYQPATVQMQGQWPIYAQAGLMQINGTQPTGNNQGKIDPKTGELLLENMQVGSLTVTRRIRFNTDEGYIRIVDVIKNSTTQEQQLNLTISSNINYGVQASQLVPNPKKPGQNLGWVAQCAAGPAKVACDVLAGPGAKVQPAVEAQQGSNADQAAVNMAIPAGKEVGFAHFHMIVQSQDQGIQWINNMKEPKLFGDLPREVRRVIVNFRAGGGGLESIDVLRGDALDVVELKSGDKFNGTLTDSAFKLDSPFGTIDLPADKVVGIVNTGQFRTRQLMVTGDGQVLGGQLQKQTVDLQLSTGQKVQIPMTQVSRVGYRRKATDAEEGAEETSLAAPYLITESGDRVSVVMPTASIPVATRYGNLQLPPASISSIAFASEDSGVHTIYLTDGSHFNGLVTSPEIELKLATAGHGESVKFAIGSLNRLVLKAASEEKAEPGPVLQLKKDDMLVCALGGTLKLDTAFDTISLDAPEVKSVVRSKENPGDVSVTTWDGTVFSGQLQDQPLSCRTAAGVELSIPAGLLETYTNPVAKVPQMMIDRVKTVAKQLGADGWKERDAAQDQLVKMGPSIVPTLQSLRADASPEAQQRIDTIIKQLQKP